MRAGRQAWVFVFIWHSDETKGKLGTVQLPLLDDQGGVKAARTTATTSHWRVLSSSALHWPTPH